MSCTCGGIATYAIMTGEPWPDPECPEHGTEPEEPTEETP